ncbi:zinc ribbon-containing protein [Shewanella marina]|uniref:zinc ribbon-containing protein n=1 Tax=Shewanella marina TaxID=487319 RepID=UPI00046FC793|nr:zinc ribbon-containing protein [Shewanella marina]
MVTRSSQLLALYDELFNRVKAEYEKDNTLNTKDLMASISQCKEYVLLANTSKRTELELVEQFLKRDIVSFLSQQHAQDLSYSPTVIGVENSVWHWLSEISDKSQIEWHEMNQDFSHQGCYHSGDIVSQGILVCNKCHHEMKIEFTGVIPDCPHCDGNEFTREPLQP